MLLLLLPFLSFCQGWHCLKQRKSGSFFHNEEAQGLCFIRHYWCFFRKLWCCFWMKIILGWFQILKQLILLYNSNINLSLSCFTFYVALLLPPPSTNSATPTTLSIVTHHVTFTALLFHCHHCTKPILYLNRRKQPVWFHVLSLLPHPFSCTITFITSCYLYQSPRHYHRLQWLYDSRRFLSDERNCKLHKESRKYALL